MAADERALDLDSGWRITEAAFRAICELLSTHPPRVIVEFGAGASSIRLAQSFPGAHILSIEHDPTHLARTQALAEHYVSRSDLSLTLRPLTWQLQWGALFRSYRPGAFPERVGAVILDGPPYYSFRGREACLHQVITCLPVGALVILDDYSRPAERAANINWDLAYRGQFTTYEHKVGHGLCVKRRIRVGPGRVQPRVVLENYLAVGLHMIRRALHRDTDPPF